jgi:serpin B
MTLAFDSGADFSGLHVPGQPGQGLFLLFALHKTFVRVDEHGTEAAAATAMGGCLGGLGEVFAPLFVADHPFLFLIRHRPTGSILFLGRLARPEAIPPTPRPR